MTSCVFIYITFGQSTQEIASKDVLFISSGHVPCAIHHFLPLGQELIEIPDALCVLVEQLRLSRYRFTAFDEIQNGNGCTIALKEVVKVPRGCRVKRIDDTD